MKRIMIIDGGPRKIFNTASMLGKIAEGAKRNYRDQHWEEDLKKALDCGRQIALEVLEH